jgi:3',5'-cyclic AMP phosphodiesterase CpdA
VITGDLTELGTPDQFEELAAVLHDARIDPDALVLVPGNHDVYTAADAWRRALAGPLRAFARAAAEAAGKVVERGDLAFLPIDATVFQPITRSNGLVGPDVVEALARRLADPALARRSVAVVLHHPPVPHAHRARQWIDGLIGHGVLADLLARHQHVQVLHGHQHRSVDRNLGASFARALGAPAVVDDLDDAPRLRVYELEASLLVDAGPLATGRRV